MQNSLNTQGESLAWCEAASGLQEGRAASAGTPQPNNTTERTHEEKDARLLQRAALPTPMQGRKHSLLPSDMRRPSTACDSSAGGRNKESGRRSQEPARGVEGQARKSYKPLQEPWRPRRAPTVQEHHITPHCMPLQHASGASNTHSGRQRITRCRAPA